MGNINSSCVTRVIIIIIVVITSIINTSSISILIISGQTSQTLGLIGGITKSTSWGKSIISTSNTGIIRKHMSSYARSTNSGWHLGVLTTSSGDLREIGGSSIRTITFLSISTQYSDTRASRASSRRIIDFTVNDGNSDGGTHWVLVGVIIYLASEADIGVIDIKSDTLGVVDSLTVVHSGIGWVLIESPLDRACCTSILILPSRASCGNSLYTLSILLYVLKSGIAGHTVLGIGVVYTLIDGGGDGQTAIFWEIVVRLTLGACDWIGEDLTSKDTTGVGDTQ